MPDFPKKVFLREDGPREGFQLHKEFVPTADKLTLIQKLAVTGIQSIEVTSFVRPDRVPQLKDAEELANGLSKNPNVRFRALYLNEKGFERASSIQTLDLEGYVLLAASEAFLKANNNQTIQQALATIPKWIALFKKQGLPFERIMLSTAFGDHHAGPLAPETTITVCKSAVEICEQEGMIPEEITLADTTGFADPLQVTRLIELFNKNFPNITPGLHLHDTRGTGMANVYAGLLAGVERFDCSVGGLGGCPFTKSPAGNVPTEDVAYLCERLGIETGVSLEAYVEAAHYATQLLGRELPGKLYRSGFKKS